ncbi:ATP synthase F1 subunit delta [Geobacter sp. DSM 9736]|uniref:ATP synthase F1 subunit delta n=1 Tax=Geobacter sp. DSM 9736 TaxID=1277350 RepID=UPI000B512614|nr:ATP synthase F1 subunit delta [Geobacter sp. DSM 9736]SNB47558.1 ATP synthase F1 subcomplex delta subunit [Geobacter sp. DSM 9736]
MITNAISRRYAKALVQLGAEEGAVDKFNDELAGFSALLGANAEATAILTSPAYGIEAKKEILNALIEKAAVSGTVGNFLRLLLDRNRLSILPQVSASFGIFADELSGVIRPTLTSGMPLEESQIAEIKAVLEKSTGKRVVLNVEVDPALIGGVVTKIGDKVFDGSVRTQLNKIEDILQKG